MAAIVNMISPVVNTHKMTGKISFYDWRQNL